VDQLNQIEHIVVLMLENRSFDSMLGKLYPTPAAFDGLSTTETNPDASGAPVGVWNASGADDVTMRIPDPDPGELWTDINTQLFGMAEVPSPTPVPSMSGFVVNYLAQTAEPAASYVAKNIMHYFNPDQVPVISKLAQQFAVCDRWFASAPCQTWPNRFFAHAATADGHENNDPTHLFEMETIFNRMQAAALDWKIYFHDIAQSKALTQLWLLADHFRYYEEFEADAKAGTLPAYSFIEPRYFTLLHLPNDQHPPHVVTLGEQLIADVYNSLRGGPQWTKTLLVITYDEHGGCYDHVPPPPAVPPGATATTPFSFDRYGVRVPAIIVSPYVPAGTILRPSGPVPYDHTSVIATLRQRFPTLGPPLTARDASAPHLGNALTLLQPENLGPEELDALPYAASPTDVAHAQDRPLNKLQESLVRLAANLPDTAAAPDFNTAVGAQVMALRQTGVKAIPAGVDADVATAANFVRARLGKFFKGL
jgi:phospholipase C